MMRQILLLFITALMCGNIAFAQTNRGSISGTVTDKNGNQPIEYATIALLEYPGGKIITGTITDSLGNFSLRITDEKEEYEKDDQGYLVDDVSKVRDAYIADLESGHDFEGEDLPAFFTR